MTGWKGTYEVQEIEWFFSDSQWWLFEYWWYSVYLVFQVLLLKYHELGCNTKKIKLYWALSLVGRAPALHAGGQGFDSPRVQFLCNGEMAERSIASDCKSDASRLRRFKSYSPQTGVPIVQWIEQQPSKLWIQVRSLVGIDELLWALVV